MLFSIKKYMGGKAATHNINSINFNSSSIFIYSILFSFKHLKCVNVGVGYLLFILKIKKKEKKKKNTNKIG